MQLTYRGAQYNYTPGSTDAIRETTVFSALRPAYNLRYRGSVYVVDPNAEPSLPILQPTGRLLYRGVSYGLNGWTKPAGAVQSTSSVVSRKPRSTKKAANTELAMVHRNNLHSNLQRRLQVARERGDQNLINLLERELHQIV